MIFDYLQDSLGSVMGLVTIICGVFLLHAFKDSKFTMKDICGTVSTGSRQRLVNGGGGEGNALMSSLYDVEDDTDDGGGGGGGGGGAGELYSGSSPGNMLTTNF